MLLLAGIWEGSNSYAFLLGVYTYPSIEWSNLTLFYQVKYIHLLLHITLQRHFGEYILKKVSQKFFQGYTGRYLLIEAFF